MKTIKHVLLGATALFLATTSCIDDFTIYGNGDQASEVRFARDFDEVKSEGNFDVYITDGNEFEVIISAESNILPYIEADVAGDRLRLHIRGIHNINNRLPMEVFITMPELEKIVQSGSGIISTDFFACDNLDVILSGSGRIETSANAIAVDAVVSGSGILSITGEAVDSDMVVSGSGRIDADEFFVRNCEASISGSGSIQTAVEDYLSASISGSGNIYYRGFPSVETHISGSGNVIHEN